MVSVSIVKDSRKKKSKKEQEEPARCTVSSLPPEILEVQTPHVNTT